MMVDFHEIKGMWGDRMSDSLYDLDFQIKFWRKKQYPMNGWPIDMERKG